MVGVMSLASAMTSFASWEQQAGGQWKYSENNVYLTGWQWIDGNVDGVSECYYLDSNGVMAVNTTIEGFTVNETGAWTVDGVVQTKVVNASSSSGSSSQNQSNSGMPSLDDITNHNVSDIIDDSTGFESGDSTGLPPMQSGASNSGNGSSLFDRADAAGKGQVGDNVLSITDEEAEAMRNATYY